jgi:pyruvate-ferredoxin/flavodoxin oxidoreductase
MLTNTALKLLRRILGTTTVVTYPHNNSVVTLLDGATAVAITESMLGEAAALGTNSILQVAELAWRNEQNRRANQFAATKLSLITAESPRGALAAAIGQAIAGLRATTFLSSNDLSAVIDLLQTAVIQHVPLVIHVAGTGHEALQIAADSGAIVLIAANVQEALDFALVARKVAEQILLPIIVAQDSDSTALSLQDAILPTPALVEQFLGQSNATVAISNPAQQFLFGDTRRSLPRWHDADRPILLGSPLSPQIRGLSQAGACVYLDSAIPTTLNAALQEFATLNGRVHQLLSRYRVEDAELVLIAQGAAVEVAETACDQARQQRIKVGVLGIRCLHPFMGNELARLLTHTAKICVLECVATPLSIDPPLLKEVRAALQHASNSSKTSPTLTSVLYGLGGMPLCVADIIALCRQASTTIAQTTVFLGINFAATNSQYPKRQVLLDKLRHNYPTFVNQGFLPASDVDVRPTGCITVSLHYTVGNTGDGLVPELATLLQRLLKGGLRCRINTSKVWNNLCVDHVNVAPNHLKDVGDNPAADLALIATEIDTPDLWPLHLAKGGSIIIVSKLAEETLLARIPASIRSQLQHADIALYRLSAHLSVMEQNELLGAISAVLIEREKLDVTKWRLLAVKDELFGTAAATQRDYFSAGLEAVRRMNWNNVIANANATQPSKDDIVPSLLRRPSTNDTAYDSLPRFWDQIGVLYTRGDIAEISPDPYLALGVVPARSAALRDLSRARINVPLLDPTQCTNCGACWSVCPEGAWNAAMLSVTQILDAGIRVAETSSLRPLLNKLVTTVTRHLQTSGTSGNLANLLETAFTTLYAQLPFPEERKIVIAKDMEKLVTTIGTLPVVATDIMFKTPEINIAGSGALLALTLNPDTCKSCAMCVTSCAPGALSLQLQDASIVEQMRRIAKIWEILPASDATLVARLQQQGDFATLGAKLLAPNVANAMCGGDSMEPGSGARLAMRLILSLTAAHQTSIQEAWKQEALDLHNKIMAQIRNLLADTLPTDDLELLSQRLIATGAAPTNLGYLLGQTQADATTSLDSARLQRLISVAKGLADLSWRLSIGRTGQGRATTGLILSTRNSTTFGIEYPYNPFGIPVTIDRTGDSPLLAAGILDGQLRQVTADFALLRRAKLELERPEQAAQVAFVHTSLQWEDLTSEEQARAGNLWLIGDSGVLAGQALSHLQRLLTLKLPLKILTLADLDLGIATPTKLELTPTVTPDADIELSLLNLIHRNVYVAQSAVSSPEHLVATVEQMLNFAGTAILHLHAPSPSRHGFPSGRSLARTHDAVTCRVFPLFRYDPRRDGVFGSRLDLDGNPPTNGRTLAHYALGEARFARLFTPLADNAPNPITIEAYLALNSSQRLSFTPFVERVEHGNTLQRLMLAPELARVCVARHEAWQMLQELAGVTTPFTARVRQEITNELTCAHQAALAEQKADYELQLSTLESRLREETRQSLRIRLLELGGYASLHG